MICSRVLSSGAFLFGSQEGVAASIVLVLECVAADELDTYPAPGGEPLWRASRHPRNIRHNAHPAETCEIRGSRERLLAPQLYRLCVGQESKKSSALA
jgi:hypothetical protein